MGTKTSLERYTDDVFTIWLHGEECFKQLLEQINKVHSSIKFTAVCVVFQVFAVPNVNVTIDERGDEY